MRLEQLIAQIEASGPVADAGARLDISTHSKSGHQYARLRNGSKLSTCGRVGSAKYLEVFSSLQRRDKIARLLQAIALLKQADTIPVAVLDVVKTNAVFTTNDAIASAGSTTMPAAKPKPAQNKPKHRKRLYTHVKTRQGSVVHAVLGKDKQGEWRTPALCGATPPQRDPMGWEFPIHEDGLTCSKCRRKLPANSERHFPAL